VEHLFDEIHTCELSPTLHFAAAQKFKEKSSIHCHLGHSPDLLKKIVPALAGRPALFWLDAYWCGAEGGGVCENQCPLLEELDAIGPLDSRSAVWIDDARYFQAPPPKPLDREGWPTFHQVLERLLRIGAATHWLIFANDTMLFYLVTCEAPVLEYLYHEGVDWLAIAHSANTILPQVVAARDAYQAGYEKLAKVTVP
jgi:hypothetical protein